MSERLFGRNPQKGGTLGKIQEETTKRMSEGMQEPLQLGQDFPRDRWYFRFANFIERVRRALASSVPQSPASPYKDTSRFE